MMIAREEVIAMTETATTAAATSTAGTVAWSLARPTATPPTSTGSAASMIVVPGPMIIVQRYEYTGRELASGSGEYYFRFRVYGPDLGQFFTRDPLGYVDGMGLYGGWFADTMSMDPRGTFPQLLSIGPPWLAQCWNTFLELLARDKDIQGVVSEINKKKCAGPVLSCLCCKTPGIAEEYGQRGNFDCGVQTPKSNPGRLGMGGPLTNPLRLVVCADRMSVHPQRYKECFWHELVHYSQYCNLTQDQIDRESCDERLCREIEAYSATAACRPGGQFWNIFGQNREDCLAYAAAASAGRANRCSHEPAAILSERARKLIPRCARNNK